MTSLDVSRLKQMGACDDGRNSVLPFATMGEWWDAQTERPDWMLWLAERLGMMQGKRLCVAIAAEFAGRVRHLMTDKRSTDALDVCIRYGAGLATDDELAAALAAACAAAWAAARAASGSVAAAAARAADRKALCDIIRKYFPASQIDRLWAERWADEQA